MKLKAIKDLAQSSDELLFKEVAHGLNLIIENARCLESDSIFLAEQGHARGCEILRRIAEEEAAKVLILLDAIRCDRKEQSTDFSRQLGYFNDHLAKLIYADCCSFRIRARFREIRTLIDQMRQRYYLEGPEGVEWIFPNAITHTREKNMYVDYIESEGIYSWISPKPIKIVEKTNIIFCRTPSNVLKLVTALDAAGFTKPDALRVIAFKWRPIKMSEDFPSHKRRELNWETLEDLEKNGLLQEQAQEVYAAIRDFWLFPLYSIDLRVKEVDQSSLRVIQG